MTTPCRCPEVPDIDAPTDAVIRCRCCGSPLELTCAGKCAPEHRTIPPRHTVKPPRVARPPRPIPADRAGDTTAAPSVPRGRGMYSDKTCRRCHAPFTPVGPNSQFCENHRTTPRSRA